MRRLMFAVALIAAPAAVPATAQVAAAQETMSKDEREIRALIATVTRGFAQRDAIMANEAYARGCAKDDRMVLFDVVPPMQDIGYWPGVRKTQALFDKTVGPVKAEWTDLHIVVDNNHAYVRSFLHLQAQAKEGKPIDVRARTTQVWEKSDGRWWVIHEHDSQPVKLDTVWTAD